MLNENTTSERRTPRLPSCPDWCVVDTVDDPGFVLHQGNLPVMIELPGRIFRSTDDEGNLCSPGDELVLDTGFGEIALDRDQVAELIETLQAGLPLMKGGLS